MLKGNYTAISELLSLFLTHSFSRLILIYCFVTELVFISKTWFYSTEMDKLWHVDRSCSGQGTISLELLEQVPQLDTLIVPISGLFDWIVLYLFNFHC